MPAALMLVQVPLPVESYILASTEVLVLDPLPYQRSSVLGPSESRMMTSVAEHAKKVRADGGAAVEGYLRAVGRRIISGNRHIADVGAGKQGVESVGRRALQIGAGLCCRGLREHQSGRIERGLECRSG